MDRQFEESNAYGKRPYKLLLAGASHADPGKRSGNLSGRMAAHLGLTPKEPRGPAFSNYNMPVLHRNMVITLLEMKRSRSFMCC
jgi:hypothetical protein